MGLLSKIMFWKKDDGLGDLGPEMGGMGPDLGLPGEDNLGLPDDISPSMGGQPGQDMPPGMGPEPVGPSASFAAPKLEQVPQQPAYAPAYAPASSMGHKDLELISVKIDQIRTSLDVLNQRLSNIERMIESQRPKW
jgi:hypothetical protein